MSDRREKLSNSSSSKQEERQSIVINPNRISTKVNINNKEVKTNLNNDVEEIERQPIIRFDEKRNSSDIHENKKSSDAGHGIVSESNFGNVHNKQNNGNISDSFSNNDETKLVRNGNSVKSTISENEITLDSAKKLKESQLSNQNFAEKQSVSEAIDQRKKRLSEMSKITLASSDSKLSTETEFTPATDDSNQQSEISNVFKLRHADSSLTGGQKSSRVSKINMDSNQSINTLNIAKEETALSNINAGTNKLIADIDAFESSKHYPDLINIVGTPTYKCISRSQRTFPEWVESKFTVEFILKTYELFTLYDKNRDGYIRPGEAAWLIRSLGLNPSDTDVALVLASDMKLKLKKMTETILKHNNSPTFTVWFDENAVAFCRDIPQINIKRIQNVVKIGSYDMNKSMVDFVDILCLFKFLDHPDLQLKQIQVEEALETLDYKKDYQIDRNNLKNLVTNYGELMTEEEADEFISYALSDSGKPSDNVLYKDLIADLFLDKERKIHHEIKQYEPKREIPIIIDYNCDD